MDNMTYPQKRGGNDCETEEIAPSTVHNGDSATSLVCAFFDLVPWPSCPSSTFLTMAPFKLVKPNEPPTPHEWVVFLILGLSSKGEWYSWDQWVVLLSLTVFELTFDSHSLPAFPTGASAPIFPVVLLCRDEDEYLKFCALAPFIHSLAQLQLDDRQDVAQALNLLKESPTLKRFLFAKYGAYPVFRGNGGRELITITW